MTLHNVKKRVEKFLLGESGGISKKKIVALGLISFVASASSAAFVKAYGQYQCFKKIDTGEIGLSWRWGSYDIPDKTYHWEGAKVNYSMLAKQGLINDFEDVGYSDDAVNEIKGEYVECGHLSDHLNDNVACRIHNHFSSWSEVQQLKGYLLHGNSAQIALPGLGADVSPEDAASASSSEDEMFGQHMHNAFYTGGGELKCHISDHWSSHTSCSWHGSEHMSDC